MTGSNVNSYFARFTLHTASDQLLDNITASVSNANTDQITDILVEDYISREHSVSLINNLCGIYYWLTSATDMLRT